MKFEVHCVLLVTGKYGTYFELNLIALRIAKTQRSFGHSEYNMINVSLTYFVGSYVSIVLVFMVLVISSCS